MPKNGRRPARLRRPGRRTGWGYEQLLLLGTLTVLAALGLQLYGRFKHVPAWWLIKHAPAWWLIALALLAVALAIATGIVKRRSAELQEDVNWTQQVRELLDLHPAPDGQPHRLSTLSPYKLGASPSR